MVRHTRFVSIHIKPAIPICHNSLIRDIAVGKRERAQLRGPRIVVSENFATTTPP